MVYLYLKMANWRENMAENGFFSRSSPLIYAYITYRVSKVKQL